MQEPYGEGLASRTGPESCVVAREGRGEALTGVHAGWVLSRENLSTSECRRRSCERKATPGASLSETRTGLRAVKDPRHAWKHHTRKPGGPALDLANDAAGSVA